MEEAFGSLPSILDSYDALAPRAELASTAAAGGLPEVDLLGDEDLRQAALGASLGLVQGRLFLGRCLLEIHRRELWAQWGYSGLNHFATLALGLTVSEGKEIRRVARALESLPLLAEAAEDGRIGWGKLREVVRVAEPEDEAYWLQAACTRSQRRLCAMIRRFKEGGDPDDDSDSQASQHVVITMRFLPEEAEVLQGATGVLSAQAGRLLSPGEAWLDLSRQVMEGRLRSTPAQLEKTRSLIEDLQEMRGAQAEAELEAVAREAGLAPGCPANAGLAPGCPANAGLSMAAGAPALPAQGHVCAPSGPAATPVDEGHTCAPSATQVHEGHACAPSVATPDEGHACVPPVSPEAPGAWGYPQPAGGASHVAEAMPDPWDVADQAPSIPWAAAAAEEAPVPGMAGFGVACASRRPHWDGLLTDAERRARVPAEAVRRQVSRRDGFQCACPDCPNTVWLEQHHLVFWCRGGLSVPGNLVLVCASCHRNIHHGRLLVSGDAERRLEWTDARGRRLGTWTAAELASAAETASRILEPLVAVG